MVNANTVSLLYKLQQYKPQYKTSLVDKLYLRWLTYELGVCGGLLGAKRFQILILSTTGNRKVALSEQGTAHARLIVDSDSKCCF